jgi:hypothetical protein
LVDFRSGYVPPGVYVTADSSGSVGVVGVGATVVCLVGRGLGYNTFTETVSFAGGNVAPLTQQGIDPESIVVFDSSQTYVEDASPTLHDYSVVQTGSGPTLVTTINREPSGALPTSTTVTVTYHYTNSTYYGLNSFSDYASFVDVYGQPFDPSTGNLISPLSMAAQVAFQNGANVIFAVSLSGTGSTASQFAAALALTLTNFDINIVVPLYEDATNGTTAESYLGALESYLVTAEADGYPRIALVGLPQAFTGTGPDVLATQVAYRRIVLVWPQAFQFYNSINNVTQTVDGIYFAAACAGVLAGQAINRGLTRSQIKNFSGIPLAVAQTLTGTNKNLWSSKGVSVAEVNRNSQLVVRHGVTTDVSSVQNREISIVREQDALFDLIQISLNQANLIGTPIIATTAMSVKAIISSALETLLTAGTIAGYTNLLVRQQALPGGDPTVIECTFSWQPTYPLNYITVVFSLDLNTGNLTTTDTASSSSSVAVTA